MLLFSYQASAQYDRHQLEVGTRALAIEFIEATQAETDEERAEKVRWAIARHVEVLASAVDSPDLRVLGSDLGLPVAHAQEITVNRAIQALIERMAHLPQPWPQALSGTGTRAARQSLTALSSLSVPERYAVLSLAGDAPFLELVTVFEQQLYGFTPSSTPALREMLDPNAFALDSNPRSTNKVKLFVELCTAYFDAIDMSTRKRILIRLLKLPREAKKSDQVAATLIESGPLIQKAFQFLAADMPNPMITEVGERFLSNVEPFGFEEVERVVRTRLGKTIEEAFSRFDKAPIAAGTIGQTHRARLKDTDQDVVVKIRRPGIVAAAQREIDRLRSMQVEPFMLEMLHSIERVLFTEFDFEREASLTKEAAIRYTRPERGIRVPKVFDEYVFEDLLVLEFVEGKTLKKLAETIDPELRGEALERLLEVFTDEAFFSPDGWFGGFREVTFFHGDLHPGNIIARVAPKPGGGEWLELTVIDFGNAGRFDVESRQALVDLMISVLGRNNKAIAEALARVSGADPQLAKALERELNSVPRKPSYIKTMQSAIARAIRLGMRLPEQLNQVLRGRGFLETQINDVNRDLDRVDPQKKRRRFSAARVDAIVFLKRIAADLSKQLVFPWVKETSMLDWKTLYRALVDNRTQIFNAITRAFTGRPQHSAQAACLIHEIAPEASSPGP